MKTREAKVVTFLEGQIIGTMYLSNTGEAYLNYCYKTTMLPIDMDEPETELNVHKISNLALEYCQTETYDLIMY